MIARSLLDRAHRRVLLLAGAVVLLSVVGIGGGLLLSNAAQGAGPTDADTFTAPPQCDSVESLDDAPLADHVPGAPLDMAESRPLTDGIGRNCVWSSVDDPEATAGTVQVDFQVFHSTDEESGADRARDSGLDPGDQQTPDPLTVTTDSAGGISHAGFVRDNLVVRVAYTATDPEADVALDPDSATQAAVQIANAVDAGL